MYKFTQSCPFHFVDEETKAQQDSKRLWTHNSSVSHLPQSLRGLPSSAVLLVGNLTVFQGKLLWPLCLKYLTTWRAQRGLHEVTNCQTR